MRITCVLGPYLPVPPALGGAVERVWQNLCSQFARKGHDVTLISRQFSNYPHYELHEGVRYLRIPSTDAPSSKVFYRICDAVYATRVACMLPRSDITITNSVSLPLLLPRSRAGSIYVSVARFPKGQMGIYRRAHRLQAVSRAVADAIRSQSPATSDRVRVIPNALSSTFSNLSARANAVRTQEILYVGRIAREKGLDILIRAFLKLPNQSEWTLTLIGPDAAAAGGDGPNFLNELKDICGYERKNIRFEPSIFDEQTLAARISSASIFVYPSVAERGESFGLAPLEAMACGCAVVVSNLACFRDFVVEGSNALVFDHRDPTGAPLARVLCTLIDQPELRAQLSASAVKTARDFHSNHVADLFLRDFDELISSRSIAPISGCQI